MVALSGAAGIALADALRGCGLPTVVYLAKTIAGDLLAGKLDQKEWWAALAAFLVLLPPVLTAVQGGALAAGPLAPLLALPAAEGGLGRILLLLTAIQLVCELGDNRLERWTFFRHRYSFEVGRAAGGLRRCGVGGGVRPLFAAAAALPASFQHRARLPQLATAALLAAVPLYPQELLAVQIDLVACLAYRLAGFSALAATSTATTRAIFAALFRCGPARPGAAAAVGLWPRWADGQPLQTACYPM